MSGGASSVYHCHRHQYQRASQQESELWRGAGSRWRVHEGLSHEEELGYDAEDIKVDTKSEEEAGRDKRVTFALKDGRPPTPIAG